MCGIEDTYLNSMCFVTVFLSQKVWFGRTRGKDLRRPPLPPCGTMAFIRWKFPPFIELLRLLNSEAPE